MARPVYSVNLLSEALVVGGVAEVTVSAGFTWVVRDITGLITPGTGSNATITVSVNGIPIWTHGAPAQIPRYKHDEGRWVAPGPSTLQALLISDDTSATAYLTISGYNLPA